MSDKSQNNFLGVIIEESLKRKQVLQMVKILKTKIEPVTTEHKTPWIRKWTLHTIEIPTEKADLIAKELSRSLDSQHNWYADFKNKQFHYIIFKDKVFHVARKSKAEYDKAMRYGLSLGIPKYQLQLFPGIATDTLTNFLREANKSTYANVKAKKAPSSRPDSQDYHFEQDSLVYHDTYFGSRDFIGEEIIYDMGCPVWGANYFGRILEEDVSGKKVYDFLRKVLMQGSGNLIPVRGPYKFADGAWEYKFIVSGNLTNFSGKEEISYQGKTVYHLLIHGGFIG